MNQKIKNHRVKFKDYRLLIVLLLTSFISVYFIPAILNRMIFLVILVAAFRTKLDYVYLVWFFIINDAPGFLFASGAFDSKRIPLYPVTGGISISFQDLFLILYIIKFVRLKNPPKLIFKKEFTWFLIYGFFVVVYSFLLGMDLNNIVKTFRFFLSWSLIFIIPAYVYNKEILVRTSLLLFPMVFLAFASQILCYITGYFPESYLNTIEVQHMKVGKGITSRFYSAVTIILFSIIQALIFFFHQKHEINKNYLGVVIFIGLFSIMLTATRGWVIALSILLLGVLVIFGFSKQIIGWFRLAIVSAIIFWIAVYQAPILQQQLVGSYQRLSTLEALVQGDMTAGGTLKRIDIRGPRVMRKFWESPLVGWGFSNDYYRYQDYHVGHHTILLNVGILGYVFINGLFASLCIKIWGIARKKEIRIYEGNTPLIYILGLIAVFVVHSSSTQFWGYSLGIDKILFLSFLFAAANSVLLYRNRSD